MQEAIDKAIGWIKNNSTEEGIYKSNQEKIIHTEVSGYFIPTLINYGERELAKKWADSLILSQQDNGSWLNLKDRECMYFTSQILDGLTEFKGYEKEVGKGMDYLMGIIDDKGIIRNNYYQGNCLRALYCMDKSAKYLKTKVYNNIIKKSIDYYISTRPYKFNKKSHFWAYGMEACIRFNKLKEFEKYIDVLGHYDIIPAHPILTEHIAPTAVAQIANAIFISKKHTKLGDKYLNWLIDNQKNNGALLKGYGGYPYIYYECSWALKFFLDACYNRRKLDNEI